MGLLRGIYKRARNFIVFFALVVLFPGVPPKTDFPFAAYSVDSPLELTGSLALNTLLDNGQRLLEGRLAGPEHVLVVGKDIYTGLTNGEVVRINGDHVTHVAKFGQPCEGFHQERKCGRPLGMAHDKVNNKLIVADTYYGIWEVDLKAGGGKRQLVSPDTIIQGKSPRKAALFNSVALASNGDIYFTDSSSEFGLEDGLYTVMANPSGRLIHWDRSKNVATALLDELAFANGVLLSPEEDFVVVAETQKARLLKYYLRGAKKGTHEPFLSGLPGHPDNLSKAANGGGFWVPLVVSRDAQNPSLMASLGQVPLMRKFLIRMLYLIEFPMKLVQQIAPNDFVDKAVYAWGHFSMFAVGFPPRQTLLKVDWSGKIVGALHGSDKTLHSIAHVEEAEDVLYLGGPFINYIGKVPLNAAAKKVLQMEEKVVKPTVTTTTTTTPKPQTTTTPKPTTTTPKPTTTTTTTTTTPKPPTTTTTTTPAPPTTTTTTPAPPTTTTTPKPAPKPATAAPKKPAKETEPAPVHEEDPKDVPPPPPQKLKVIKKGNVQEEL